MTASLGCGEGASTRMKDSAARITWQSYHGSCYLWGRTTEQRRGPPDGEERSPGCCCRRCCCCSGASL